MFRVVVLLALSILSAACARGVSIREPETTRVDLREFVEGLKTATVNVNGESLNMIFDTGAGVTVLTPQAAARVGCSVFAEETGFRMDGKRLDVPVCGPVNVELGAAHATVQRAAVGAFFGEPPPVDGMISLHALEHVPFELHLDRHEILLHTAPLDPARLRSAGWKEVVIREGREAGGDSFDVYLGVGPNDRRLWMEFDSGSTEATLLRPSAARTLGVRDGKGSALLGFADDVSVSADVEVREDLIYDGVIGGPEISKHGWLFDLAHMRAWVRSNDVGK
jgi:hypothetical protein